MTTYISDSDHYSQVLARLATVKKHLWIGTADIKDLYVMHEGKSTPLLGVIAQLIRRGVAVRFIHAKDPGPNFREDFDRYPVLIDRLERVLCPRVHFKLMIFDLETAYIGSANLTGEPEIVSQAISQFDSVWMGQHCKDCRRKNYCSDPIV